MSSIPSEPKEGALDDEIPCDAQTLRDRIGLLALRRDEFVADFTAKVNAQANDPELAPEMVPLAVLNEAGELVTNPDVTWPQYRSTEWMLREYEELAGKGGRADVAKLLDQFTPVKRLWLHRVLTTHGITDPTCFGLSVGMVWLIEQLCADAAADRGYFSTWPEVDTPEELAEVHPLRMAVPEDIRKTTATVEEWLMGHDEGARRSEAATAMHAVENTQAKPRKGVIGLCEKWMIPTGAEEHPSVTSKQRDPRKITVEDGFRLVVCIYPDGDVEQRMIEAEQWEQLVDA